MKRSQTSNKPQNKQQVNGQKPATSSQMVPYQPPSQKTLSLQARQSQQRFASQLALSRAGKPYSTAGLTTRQQAALSASRGSLAAQTSNSRALVAQPQQLTPEEFRELEEQRMLRSHAHHLHHPARPLFSGEAGLHKYAYARVCTSVNRVTVDPGAIAVIFNDPADGSVVCWTGAAALTWWGSGTPLTLGSMVSDDQDFRAGAGFTRARVPSQRHILKSLVANDNSLSASPDIVCPNFTSSGSEVPNKVQCVYNDFTVQHSIPFGGSAVIQVVAPGIDHAFCGDNARICKFPQLTSNGGILPMDGLDGYARIPNMDNGTLSVRDWVSTYGKTMAVNGATPQANMVHKVIAQKLPGWFVPGRRSTITANGTDSLSNGNLPSNALFRVVQGAVVITNTSTTDSCTVVFSGKFVYAVTAPSSEASAVNALTRSVFERSEYLQRTAAVPVRDIPHYSNAVGSHPSEAPVDNSVVVSDHNRLNNEIESGLAMAGVSAAAGSKVGKALAARAAQGARSVANAGFGWLRREGGAFMRGALGIGEEAAMIGARTVPLLL